MADRTLLEKVVTNILRFCQILSDLVEKFHRLMKYTITPPLRIVEPTSTNKGLSGPGGDREMPIIGDLIVIYLLSSLGADLFSVALLGAATGRVWG